MTALPNTILIGAAKAGTTSLCGDLQHHPDIYLYPSKETHFFSYRYDRGIDYYKSLFDPAGEKVIVDATPEYSTRGKSQIVADRMREHVPDAKLIYMVRQPIRRIESEYVQKLANGAEHMDFDQAVMEWRLLHGSLYEENYQIFAKAFSPERIHVIFFEDYLADKAATISSLLRYLGVDDHPAVFEDRKARNTRDEKISDPSLVKSLRNFGAFERYKHLLPDGVKLFLKRSISRKIETDIVWTDALRDKITPIVQNDAALFLERFGKKPDFWF